MHKNLKDVFKWIENLDKTMISVVLPTYNRPIFLERSLFFLVEQVDAPRFEVIVVDDGSSAFEQASNARICDVYKQWLDITYVKLPINSGTVSIPRAIGISYISGRYIAPTDDDCFSEKHKLFCLYDEISKLNMMYTPLVYGDRYESVKQDDKFITTRQAQFPNHYMGDVGIDNGQFIYNAAVYLEVAPKLHINACDWELYKEINKLGVCKYVNEYVCNYIWHEKNISRTPKPNRVNPYDVIEKFRPYFNPCAFTDLVFDF